MNFLKILILLVGFRSVFLLNMVRDIMIAIMRDNTIKTGDYRHVREMAAYALRIIADADSIIALQSCIRTEELPVDRPAQALDEARLSFHVRGDKDTAEQKRADVVYSSLLEQSVGARQFIKDYSLHGDEKPILIVDKKDIDSNMLNPYLTKLGLVREQFSEIFCISDFDDMDKLVAALMSKLREGEVSVETIRLLAVGDRDLLNPWRKQAVTVLALLFNKDTAKRLGAGTYIELRGGDITKEIREEERYRYAIDIGA